MNPEDSLIVYVLTVFVLSTTLFVVATIGLTQQDRRPRLKAFPKPRKRF